MIKDQKKVFQSHILKFSLWCVIVGEMSIHALLQETHQWPIRFEAYVYFVAYTHMYELTARIICSSNDIYKNKGRNKRFMITTNLLLRNHETLISYIWVSIFDIHLSTMIFSFSPKEKYDVITIFINDLILIYNLSFKIYNW